MTPRALALVVSLALAALASHAQAGVTVVDATSPTPVLQAAIDAAPAGEILLVLAGPSEAAQTITIAGKGLTVVAWPAGVLIDVDRLRIENLPAGSRVVVRGFRMTPALPLGSYWVSGSVAGAAIELINTAGAVWIEDCEARSPDQHNNPSGYGNHGASLVGCANVVLMRCGLVAGSGANQNLGCGAPFAVAAQDGGSGLQAGGSTVALHECSLEGDSGGAAMSGECPVPASAGDGLRLQYGSYALVAGCTLKGGNQAWTGNTAGSGIRVDEDSTLALRGSTTLSGSGSPPLPPPISAALGSTLTQYASVPRQVEISSPLAEGQPGSITVTGQPGDLTALFMAFSGASFAVPAKQGMFSLGTPFFGPFILGTNPSGAWTVPFNAPPLNPSVLLGQSFCMQLVVHDGVQATFEGTTSFVLVDGTLP